MRRSSLYRAVMSRVSAAVLLAALAASASFGLFAQTPAAPAKPAPAKGKAAQMPVPQPIATMSQLMIDLIYPTSNDIFS